MQRQTRPRRAPVALGAVERQPTYKDSKPLDGKIGRLLFLTMISRVPQSMELIDELIEKDPRPQASRVNKNESATTAKRQIGAALDDDAIAHADRTM
jgi:hypothetical protein